MPNDPRTLSDTELADRAEEEIQMQYRPGTPEYETMDALLHRFRLRAAVMGLLPKKTDC